MRKNLHAWCFVIFLKRLIEFGIGVFYLKYFKLKQCGISGNVLGWIHNYVTDRKQNVFIGNSVSDTKAINAGVPQGSVLCPLLFLVYVNDIADSLLSTTRLFADDSSLAVSSSNTREMEIILNADLTKIAHWAKQWLVNFNPSKTEVMFFSLSRNIDRPELSFNNTRLDFVDNHKHLGLTLSEDGKWHAHINDLTKSA